MLNIDLVINRPNKYGKPQCSADNIKGIISSQPNLFHQCLCPFDLCVANALRDLKKVNNYRFFLLMFYSLWNLVLCIANKLRDLKKVFFYFLCVRLLWFARVFLDLNTLSHNLQSKDIPSMCVSA